MLGDMFLWLVANLKQGIIYFIKQALPPNISAGSVVTVTDSLGRQNVNFEGLLKPDLFTFLLITKV